jgi:hypothetical protein
MGTFRHRWGKHSLRDASTFSLTPSTVIALLGDHKQTWLGYQA